MKTITNLLAQLVPTTLCSISAKQFLNDQSDLPDILEGFARAAKQNPSSEKSLYLSIVHDRNMDNVHHLSHCQDFIYYCATKHYIS